MTAADVQRLKDLLPTRLGSGEIRESIAADILRRSVFSARMECARHLARLRDTLAALSAGEIDEADARARLLASLAEMGHSPLDGGGIANPASVRRLELVLSTNRQMAASVARLSGETPATLAQWPAWRLTRAEGRGAPRDDWQRRWKAAGDAVGWEGARRTSGLYPDWDMAALKSSPVWEALGNGAGGFRDALGNPYPPFAYGSGLDWEDVDADGGRALGLLADGEEAGAPGPAALTPGEREIAEAIRRLGGDFGAIAEGVA